MQGPSAIAGQLFKARQSDILRAYADAARAEVPAARTLGDEALIDSLPRLLENLIEVLEHGENAHNLVQGSEIGLRHGRERAGQLAYSLHDLLVEYRILSRVLFAMLRQEGEVPGPVFDVIQDVIHRGVANSASEFQRLRSEAECRRVAEQEQLLREAKETHALLEAVIRYLPVGLSVTDKAGTSLFHNERLDQLVERPVSTRSSFRDYAGYGAIHADGRPYRTDEYPIVRVLETGTPIRDEQMLYRRRDGSVSTFLVSCTPVHDSTGMLQVAVTTVYDVTDERRFQAMAARASKELHLVADAVPTHLLHLDREERILFANRSAANMWRLRPEEMVGKTIEEIVGPETHRLLEPHTKRVLAGEVVSYTQDFTGPAGTRRIFLNTYLPEKAEDGNVRGFVVTGTDITDQKNAEENLLRTATFRERFIGILGHDLRNPLSGIKASTDLLLKSEELKPGHRKALLRVSASAERMTRMISDVLDLALGRLGGGIPVKRERINLHELCTRVVDELHAAHPDRVFHLERRGDPWGDWDPDRMSQVVSNLVGNALAHGDPDSDIRVTVGEKEGGDAVVVVQNRGPAIPAEALPTLFEPFRGSENTTERRSRGLGLGLYIVDEIVRAHGGTASIVSDAELGTRATLQLPRVKRAAR